MRIEQRRWTSADGWTAISGEGVDNAQLVLVFGGGAALGDPVRGDEIRAAFPTARIVGCSTAGEIAGTEVLDDAIVATAIRFERTTIRTALEPLPSAAESQLVGERLARALLGEGLRHILVIAEGVRINGSELLAGMRPVLPTGVTVSGGLAGDAARFEKTCVCFDGVGYDHHVAAIGFYGDRLVIGHGSMGGWDPFGPERRITRSQGNVLYELDGGSALALYKEYLGPHAADLPASGLLFPLDLILEDGTRLVRTILGVDEAAGSLTFAGDVPEGARAQLMKANFDRLIDGAQGAAEGAHATIGRSAPALAVLISCVGRKLVLGQRIEEEVEAVRDVLGPSPVLTGFYSYGEIAPTGVTTRCELHNQTMTITTFDER
ncbi:MAG: FIST signal transduction protein [Gemmatimonadaceae bacterium]